MKLFNKIFTNVCILFVLILSILVMSQLFNIVSKYPKFFEEQQEKIDYFTKNPQYANDHTISDIESNISSAKDDLIKYSIYTGLSCLGTLACVYIFVYVNPRLFRKSTYTSLADEWEKNKTERAADKQAREEEAKKKRIEELQNELDELKKD